MNRTSSDALARALRGIFDEAVRGARERISDRTAEALVRRAKAGESWRVVAVGKAAVTMFEGACVGLARANATIAGALVVAPDGVTLPAGQKNVVCMHSAHPLPDARSVRAADRAIDVARRAATDKRGNLLVLVSGGASSLLSKPAGISLEKNRAIVDSLLRAGATIEEINLVRRHTSLIKGGGLLRAAGKARVVTLIVSDVLADAPWDIGSGPSISDPTTRAQAKATLARLSPEHAAIPLVETRKPRPRAKEDVEVVASPSWFAREIARLLRVAGLRTRVLVPSNADVESFARRYVHRAHEMKPGTAVVRAAEPGVRVRRSGGKGGRCTHLAALVARDLDPGVAFLAGATDGVDGSSGTAGAVVHAGAIENQRAIEGALRDFETGPLHRRAGTALTEIASGVNFADVHVLARIA